jgi:hypothetical protein
VWSSSSLELVRRSRRGTTVMLVEQSVERRADDGRHRVLHGEGRDPLQRPDAELLERPDLLRSVFLEGAESAPQPGPGTGRTPSSNGTGPDTRPAGPPINATARRWSWWAVTRRFGGINAVEDVEPARRPRRDRRPDRPERAPARPRSST